MSVTAPSGFVAAGIHTGIKSSGALDLALVATVDRAAVPTAAVFTTNKMTAAPVVVSRRHLTVTAGRAVAVILNSGNANAATGTAGEADAEQMCASVGAELGCDPEQVLVCSTGTIGVRLPMWTMAAGIPKLAAALAGDEAGGADAATAILTTDTHRKEVVVEGAGFSVGGMAKGAGMLAPDMATMLAVLTTDAAADPTALRDVLAGAVADTFNALSIDGCSSTNDTVVLLAGGRAGDPAPPAAELGEAVEAACADLAAQLADDAEGATKVVRLRVIGARSAEDARRAARRVAESALVKCSWYGEDPYWGRIASELGSAGADFDPDRLTIAYGGVVVARAGVAVDHDEASVARHLAQRHVEITADLDLGHGEATMLATDLSHAYVDENMGRS